MIRKSALIVVAVVVILVGIAVFVLGDLFVEEILESTLKKGLNTEVDIVGLDLNPIELSAGFDGLKIKADGDGSQNIVETGAATFDVLGMQLLAEKLVINRLSVENVILESTARLPKQKQLESAPGSSGSTPQTPGSARETSEAKITSLEKLAQDLPELDLDVLGKEMDIDEFIHPEKLESIKAIKKAEKEGYEKLAYWKEEVDNARIKKEITQLKADAYALRKLKIESVSDLEQALIPLKQLRNKAIGVETQAKQLHEKAVQDWTDIKKSFYNIKSLTRQDIKNAEKLANLQGINAGQIGMMLFGKETISSFQSAEIFLETARGFFWKAETAPERKAGRIVNFPVTATVYPQFLIQELKIAGKILEKGRFDKSWVGSVYNLTQDQDLMGLPTTFDITSTVEGQPAKYALTGNLDNRNGKEKFTLLLKGTNLELKKIELKKGDKTWPNYMHSKDAELTVELGLKEDSMKGSIVLLARSVQFGFANPAAKNLDQASQAVRGIFKDIALVEIRSTVSGKLTDPKLSVSSNIDDILSKQLDELLGAKIAQARAEIKRRINSRVDQTRKEAEARLQQEKQNVMDQANSYRRESENQKQQITNLITDTKRKKQQELDRARKELEEKVKRELRTKQAELEKAGKELEAKQKAALEKQKRELKQKQKELEAQLKQELKGMFK